jgi:hypothetical protein
MATYEAATRGRENAKAYGTIMATYEVATRGREIHSYQYSVATCRCPLQVMSPCQTQQRIGMLQGELWGRGPQRTWLLTKGILTIASNSIDYRHQLPFGRNAPPVSLRGQLRNCKFHKSLNISYLREYGARRKPVRGVHRSL